MLAADIPDTDYAELLVGVARHECPGLLLGAHGVAPSKGSLARRVARVLDAASPRSPVARPFAVGVLAGALLVAAPLAALTVTPAIGTKSPALGSSGKAMAATNQASSYYPGPSAPSDLPHIIADGVSTAVAVVSPPEVAVEVNPREVALAAAGRSREAVIEQAKMTAAQARQTARQVQLAARRSSQSASDEALDRVIEARAVGVTPEYVAAMRAAVPRLARLDYEDFAGLKAVGVTPDYARSLVAAGLRNIDSDELTEARAVGVTGAYVSALAAAGLRGTMDDYVQLRAVGVTPEFGQRVRRAGYTTRDPDKLVEMQALGLDFSRYRMPPPPPQPRPPRAPRNPDPGDDPDPDPDGG